MTWGKTVTSKLGGKQSDIGARFDLVPSSALKLVAETMHEGEGKYGENNWRLIEAESHINHALAHLYGAIRVSDIGPGHLELSLAEFEAVKTDLAHAACRALMALEVFVNGTWQADDPRITGPEEEGLPEAAYPNMPSMEEVAKMLRHERERIAMAERLASDHAVGFSGY